MTMKNQAEFNGIVMMQLDSAGLAQMLGPLNPLPMVDGNNGLPVGATQVNGASGNVANAIAAASLPADAAKTNYLTGFEISAAGATVGLPVIVTVTGVLGGTLSYIFAAPAGALVLAQPLAVNFPRPLQGAAVNTAITVSCPALGVGNTNAAAAIHGYKV